MPYQWTRLKQIKNSFFHYINSYKILKCNINKPNEVHNQSITQSINQAIIFTWTMSPSSVFRPWDYRNLLYLPDACRIFKAARTPTLLKAMTNLCIGAVPSAPVDSSVYDKSQDYRQISTLSDQIWTLTFCLCYHQTIKSRGQQYLSSKKPLWILSQDDMALASDLYIGHCLDTGKRT